jgi:multidrug efflux pump subunit AcrA (membrane-fusion protein)
MPTVRYLLLSICLVILLLPFTGCVRESSEQENSSGIKPVVTVKTAMLKQGDAEVVIHATGRTEALRREVIVSPIAGVVKFFKVAEGTALRQGDTLALIQTKESKAAVDGAQSLLDAAATPEQKADAARALEIAKTSISLIPVRAPISGTVAARNIVEEALVSENAELATIVDLTSLAFIADVPLRELAGMKPGQQGRLHFASVPDGVFDATVNAINPTSDSQSQTARVRLAFTSSTGDVKSQLKAEMIGTAEIVIGLHTGVLLAPKAALLRDDETNTYSIVTITSDSLSLAVPVAVGLVTDSSIEVSGNGLKSGMVVLIEGNYALPDSTHIHVVQQRDR